MNKNSRNFLQLTQLYDQRKAFELHRKKINRFRHNNLIKGYNSESQRSLQNHKWQSVHSLTEIKQQISASKVSVNKINDHSSSRISPFCKKKEQQHKRVHQILKRKIQTVHSILDHSKISKEHTNKFQNIKKRLQRYIEDPQTHQIKLKRQKTLQCLKSHPLAPQNIESKLSERFLNRSNEISTPRKPYLIKNSFKNSSIRSSFTEGKSNVSKKINNFLNEKRFSLGSKSISASMRMIDLSKQKFPQIQRGKNSISSTSNKKYTPWNQNNRSINKNNKLDKLEVKLQKFMKNSNKSNKVLQRLK